MAFSDFRYPDVLAEFGLTEDSADLFDVVPDLPASDVLLGAMRVNRPLATLMNTEKARSELLVAPVLADLWGRMPGRVNLHSGVVFAADPDEGLTGLVDFVISRGPQLPRISPPVLVAFEAKRDSIADGYGQCIAAMVGAQRFNRRANRPAEPMYGCVTTGSVWKFLRLRDAVLSFDAPEYNIHQLDRLLGILAFAVGGPPAPAVAA